MNRLVCFFLAVGCVAAPGAAQVTPASVVEKARQLEIELKSRALPLRWQRPFTAACVSARMKLFQIIQEDRADEVASTINSVPAEHLTEFQVRLVDNHAARNRIIDGTLTEARSLNCLIS